VSASSAAREKRFAVMSHRRRPQAAGDPDSSPYPKKKATRRPSWTVLALVVAFRAANALLVRTYFNPDEHWQCLELAHRVAFGYRIRVHNPHRE
jgi:GPI mannosyltransferase 3